MATYQSIGNIYIKSTVLRDIKQSEFQNEFSVFCQNAVRLDFDILVYMFSRGVILQANMFAKGRTKKQLLDTANRLEKNYHRRDLAIILQQTIPKPHESKITNAPPGFSAHNYDMAFDAVPYDSQARKALWTDAEKINEYGKCVRDSDLVWGGAWKAFPDRVHAQSKRFNYIKLIETYNFKK